MKKVYRVHRVYRGDRYHYYVQECENGVYRRASSTYPSLAQAEALLKTLESLQSVTV